jgi:hypothetical protein
MKHRGEILSFLLVFVAVFSSQGFSTETQASAEQASSPIERLDQLIEDLDQVQRYGSDFYLVGPNIAVENCKSYPHYSIVRTENRNGHQRLIEDLKEALDQGLRCMLEPESGFATEHKENALELLQYLSDASLQKTFSCQPGIDKAVAYSNFPNFDPSHPGFLFVKDLIPAFPGMLLDTNALAGNHHLYVERKITPLSRDELDTVFHQMADEAVFNRGLPKENSIPYSATPMLLFHEMLHWTGYVHGEFHLIDETRLLQAACMGKNIFTEDVSPEMQQKARAILSDQAYWDLPVFARPEYAGENEYHVDMFAIFEHTYNSGRFYSPETLTPLPAEWVVNRIGDLTLYGPEAEVQFASQILDELSQSTVDLHREIYATLTSGEHLMFAGPDPAREAGLATALFPSMKFNMFNMGVLSGQENNEDFQPTLASNAYGLGRYMAHRSEVDHSLPAMPGVDGWTAGYFFEADDTSLDFINDTSGPKYTLKQRIIYEMWKFSHIIDNNDLQAPRRFPPRLLRGE